MDYGVEAIKRQSRRMRLAVGHRSACDRRLSLRPIGPTPALSCVMTSASAVAVCDLRRYTSVICLYAFALVLIAVSEK